MEPLFVYEFVTKGLQANDDRTFGGYLSVEVVDKQDEIVAISELAKVLPIWMERGAPLTDTHSNRIVGKGTSFVETEYEGHAAIYITGKVFKNYMLDDDVWAKMKSGEYKGLSMGGATKAPREPVNGPDGRLAYRIKDLEQYEVAICKDPANPLALIDMINTVVKSKIQEHNTERGVVQCTSVGCILERPELTKSEDKVEDKEEKELPIEKEEVEKTSLQGVRTNAGSEELANTDDATQTNNIDAKRNKAMAEILKLEIALI